MSKPPYTIVLRDEGLRAQAAQLIYKAPDGTHVTFQREEQRSRDQNDMLHPLLRIIAKQGKWYGATLSEDEWKCVFLSGIREVKAIPGYEPGTVIMTGLSSSKLTKEEFSNLLDLVLHYGATNGIDLTDPRQEAAA